MGRLTLFVAVLGTSLGLVAGLNWWVDPFGQFYDDRLVARAERDGCLISNDLLGAGSWLRFKEEIVRRREPQVVVLGTSRVLKLRAHEGERRFANFGLPGTGPNTLAALFERLRALSDDPLTIYLGVELFWFNPTWFDGIDFGGVGVLDTVRYVLARPNARQSLRLVLGEPRLLLERVRRVSAGETCVLDRASRTAEGTVDAWAVDGSFVYRFELVPDPARRPDDDFTRDLVKFQGIYYRDWTRLERARLDALDGALGIARGYGWTVVGFAPPYSSRYVRRLATAPQTASQWRAFGEVVPALFARHRFPFVDLRAAGDVPCGDDEFVDDGWHPNAECAARVRSHLDEAAATVAW